jgi:hypothetical protein
VKAQPTPSTRQLKTPALETELEGASPGPCFFPQAHTKSESHLLALMRRKCIAISEELEGISATGINFKETFPMQ